MNASTIEVSGSKRIVSAMSNATRSMRGSPCSPIRRPSSTTVNPPTPAIAISVVSSRPRLPGVSRPRPKRAVASRPPAAGRPNIRQAGPAIFSASRTQRLVLALVQPGMDLAAQLRVVAQAHEEVQPEADRDDRAEREQPARDVLREPVEGLPEDVAEHAERRRPRARADDVVGQELPQRHLRGARDERRERAHEADEAADQDRQAAALLEEALDLVQALLGDLQPLAVAQQPVAAELAPERVGGHVAGDRRGPHDRDQHEQVDLPLARRPGRRPAPRSRRARRARRTRPSRGTRAGRRAGTSTCRASCRRPRSASRCSAGRSRRCRRARRRRRRARRPRARACRACGGATNRNAESATAASSQPHFTPRAPPRSAASTGSAAIPPTASAAARARSGSS